MLYILFGNFYKILQSFGMRLLGLHIDIQIFIWHLMFQIDKQNF